MAKNGFGSKWRRFWKPKIPNLRNPRIHSRAEIIKESKSGGGGKIGPTRWASPVHPELGPGWAIKLLALKKSCQIWPDPIWLGPVWPDPSHPNLFLPSKGYLAQPARFLRRVGLLKFWPEKSGPILARPGFGPAHCCRPIASSRNTCWSLLRRKWRSFSRRFAENC